MCVKTKQPKAQAWLTNLNELILGIELGSLNLKLILSLASEPSSSILQEAQLMANPTCAPMYFHLPIRHLNYFLVASIPSHKPNKSTIF